MTDQSVGKGQIGQVKRGDPGPKASDWNHMARFINEFGSGNTVDRPHYVFITNTTGLAIPANGVFSVGGGAGSTTPDRPRIGVQQGPGDILLTALESIPNTATAHALMIGRFIPVKVSTVPGEVPGFAQPCGPVTGQWGVSSNGEGLIAVSAVDTDGNIFVVSPGGGATRPLKRFKVITEIPAAPGDGSQVAGGQIQEVIDDAGNTSGITEGILSQYSATIPVDVVGHMEKNSGGDWEMVTANCENVPSPLSSPIEEQTDGDTMQSGAGTVLLI